MSDVAKAVFLSYAREDAEAARRIADALRSHGVEVWFDQNELRGGDAWDAKIRRQIGDCTLFLPIISASTQDRSKGYFRLEWKLAVEQTHLMAEGVAYLAPVVIDATPEGGALVPPEFLRVQWTRLPGGLPTPQFVSQIQRLLESPAMAPMAAKGPAAAPVHAPVAKGGVPRWSIGAGVAVVVAISTALWVSRKQDAVPAALPAQPPVAAPAAAPASSDAKSLAVLPFANLSTDKENEYFADGVHDDVITNLAKIRDLKVISRTSVLAYRDPAARNLKKIAAELGVANILEGSIRRVGNKVHMNAQLIDARTDEHLWADTFDGDTADVFDLQSRLAQQIAAALKATLTGSERALIERRPTENSEAYNAFLRGRVLEQTLAIASPRQDYEPVVAQYEKAIALDPSFALAHVQLAIIHGQMYWFGGVDPTAERRAKALAELQLAQRLAPDAPEVRYAQGAIIYLCDNDWERALAEFRAAEPSLPNDSQLQYRMGVAYRRLGQMHEAIRRFERSAALNPHDLPNLGSLVETLLITRHYEEGLKRAREYEALFPYSDNFQTTLGRLAYALDDNRAAFLASLAGRTPLSDDPRAMRRDFVAAMTAGDLAKADRLLETPEFPPLIGAGGAFRTPLSLARAEIDVMRGNSAAAKRHAQEALAEFQGGSHTIRQDMWVRVGVARALACAGEVDEGVRGMLAGLKELERRDQMLLMAVRPEVARTLAIVGRREEALACLRDAMLGACPIPANELRHDIYFTSLRADPRFEEILRMAKVQ